MAAIAKAELDESEDSLLPELMDDEDMYADTIAFAMDTQQYKRYKTLASIKEYCTVGLPMSFVVAQVGDTCQTGFVLGSGRTGHLVPLHVGTVAVSTNVGFTYFDIHINYDVGQHLLLYSLGDEGTAIQHYNVLNYGHLLPHLATLELGDPLQTVPYAVVTTNANHRNTSYNFVSAKISMLDVCSLHPSPKTMH